MFLLSLLVAGAAPPAPLPSADEARRAAQRALPYLLKSSAAWRDNRKCVTCHQVPFALWPLHEAKARGSAIDQKALDALADWSLVFCTTDRRKNTDEPTGGHLKTMVGMALALEAGPASDPAKKALELFVPILAKAQRPDGSFKEGNFIGVKGAEREGIDVDTLWTMLGLNSIERQIGKTMDDKTRSTLSTTRQKAMGWLKDAKPAAPTDWLALKMLLCQERGEAAEAARWRAELLARQNADGGWPWVKGEPSHPLVTGECLYVLGPKGDEGAVRRAWGYLVATQQKDGTWKADSRQARGTGVAGKVNAVTIHWGTGWAAIGLLRTLPTAAR